MQIMLSSGLLIYIQVDLSSGDIQKIVFDKYLLGKLSERLSDGKFYFLIYSINFIYKIIQKINFFSYYYKKLFSLYIQ